MRQRNAAWAKERPPNSTSDWLKLRALRNKCTVQTRKTKGEYYLKPV